MRDGVARVASFSRPEGERLADHVCFFYFLLISMRINDP